MGWLADHWVQVLRLTLEHVVLSVTALLIALAVAVPLALWAHGTARRTRLVLGIAGALYTVPSLALFALLVPLVGLGRTPAIVGLVLYSQLMLVRAILSGLESVPREVRDAALGMGLDRWKILTSIEAPLALPVFVSGLRLTVVTVIGIATIGALIGAGGLGELILQGIQRDYGTLVIVGSLAVGALALTTDWLLVRLERRLRPWGAPA